MAVSCFPCCINFYVLFYILYVVYWSSTIKVKWFYIYWSMCFSYLLYLCQTSFHCLPAVSHVNIIHFLRFGCLPVLSLCYCLPLKSVVHLDTHAVSLVVCQTLPVLVICTTVSAFGILFVWSIRLPQLKTVNFRFCRRFSFFCIVLKSAIYFQALLFLISGFWFFWPML